MTDLKTLKTVLALGSALIIAACDGSVDVASPGEAVFNGSGSGSGGGGGGGGGGSGPAASCPTGFVNVGLVANSTLRNCQLPNLITGALTVPFVSGTVYSLSGRVDVGVDRGGDANSPIGTQGILTVEPGVKIFGSAGLDYMVVNRGSQIFAIGTPTEPIVMTSRQSIEGTTGIDSIGQWGGLVILGRAYIVNCPGATAADQAALYGTAACENEVEGTNAQYGGNSQSDNSGILRYFRLMHSGFEVLPNNELNGITFAGVGSGTTVDHIQVHNSSDDAIEWFGGNVNLKYVVLTGADDDNLDTDQGYRGVMQFVIVVQAPARGNHWWEWSTAASAAADASATPALRKSRPVVANFTVIGSQSSPQENDSLFNQGTQGISYNGIMVSTKPNTFCIDIDDALTRGTNPIFKSVVFSCTLVPPFSPDVDGAGGEETDFFHTGVDNNNSAFVPSLTNTFVNGANETAVTPVTFAAQAELTNSDKSFLTQVPYIGAVKDANDTWWQGWTCGIGGGPAC